ncbi:MAG: hypothetical protein GXO29_06715 [Thermotogae bacterium]|nr:hypothetical protein [Thermotogota bacterium]
MRFAALTLATVSMIAAPVALQAQAASEACQQAQMDVQNDVNGTLWLAAGFFLGILGVGAAYVLEPDPPATRLVGKDPQYVAVYTDCYKRAGKDIQVKKAAIGCVASTVLATLCYGSYCCLVAGAAASANSGY